MSYKSVGERGGPTFVEEKKLRRSNSIFFMEELLVLQCTVVATPGKYMLGNESRS